MKVLSILGVLIFLTSWSRATNPEFSRVPQPANLVGDSTPGCIPLTAVACYHNYGSGLAPMISAPHPFLGGAKDWQRGNEADSNLASVFGIRVRGDFPFHPTEIHIKDWDVPAYSPHTRAEVLAATIHCVLLVSNPTPSRPLEITITTENKKDREWAAPFAKKYVRLPDRDQKPVTPTPVGDSFIKTDGFGIQYVISPKINPHHLTPKIAPVILTHVLLAHGRKPATSGSILARKTFP